MKSRNKLNINLIITSLLIAVVGMCGGVRAKWVITQLTDNSYDDTSPQISGSNVVWEGEVGDDDSEIFFYNGSKTIQLTDNDYDDFGPQISGSNIVWQGYYVDDTIPTPIDENDYEILFYDDSDSEIFFYNGSTITQLTNNSYNDNSPQISGTNVVWWLEDPSDWEIFLYDGSTINQLTDNGYEDGGPQVSGSNVVWHHYIDNYEIFFYDGSTTKQLTDNYNADYGPQISGSNVVWQGWDGSDYEIFFHDGNSVTQLTNNYYGDSGPQISGSNIVWQGYDGNDTEIFFYDGNSVTQLTHNGYNDNLPQISGSNIVWRGVDGNDLDIFFYDGNTVSQLTDNSYQDDLPQISGSKVVWQGWDGSDYEIFMAVNELIIYVDASADGNDDGTSWTDAFNHLQDALLSADAGYTIHVAQGTYYPDTNSAEPNGTGDRTATFQLKNGVRIIGGYIGNSKSSTSCIAIDSQKWEIDLNCCRECQPDPNRGQCGDCMNTSVGKTILSGDIGISNDVNDNSFHVVNGSGTDSTAMLENVTITGGNADGNYTDGCGGGIINNEGNPTVMYCNIVGNNAIDAGGGVYNLRSSPTLTSNSFCDNTANWGAGLGNFARSKPAVTNCVFRNNDANQAGGGISNTVISDPVIVNCTFYANRAGFFGGGIYNNGSDPNISNSILWANSASTGAQIALVANNRRTYIGYCDIQGGTAAVYRENAAVIWNGPILDVDPNFVDPNNCNLRLRANSPCLDFANNDAISWDIYLDRDANPRFIEIPDVGFDLDSIPIADLGAYERSHVIYVDSNATGEATGSSWGDAYVFLQDALVAVQPYDQIWVAKGKYTPDRFSAQPNLRFHPEQSFELKNGVALYGGFDGTETDITDRDCNSRNNETVLSGDLFGDDDIDINEPFGPTFFENSWNIVTADANTDANTVLNGFTIRGGYANGTTPNSPWTMGGGIHNLGRPTISGCLLEYNWAFDKGGGMYNEGSPMLVNCEFKNNFSRQQGAGLCNIGGSPILLCCDFTTNKDAKYGVGMYNDVGGATLVKCTFSNNGPAQEYGGGMVSILSDIRLHDCKFINNESYQDGGAMFNALSSIKLFNCSFQDNSAHDDGGGIYNFLCTDVNVVNCAFLGNTALSGWGGGIHNDICFLTEIINCTFTENDAEEGGGIYNGYNVPIIGDLAITSSSITIKNSILWEDVASYGPEISLEASELSIFDSIIKGGVPEIFVWGDVSIYEYTLYTDDPLIDSDGRPSALSPVRDEGRNIWIHSCVTTDLDGNPRIYGDAVDIGAYELGHVGDLDFSGGVDMKDYSNLAYWNQSICGEENDSCDGTDINRDGKVDWYDVRNLVENWLIGK